MMESLKLFNNWACIHEEIYSILLWIFEYNDISLNIFERYPTLEATKIKGGSLYFHND